MTALEPLDSLDDVLVVNAGSTSVKLTRLVDGRETSPPDLDAAIADRAGPRVVVHRVVHGGHRTRATVVDDAVMAELRGLTELAPLHQSHALDIVEQCRRKWPHATQIACFDTTFHTTMPPGARTYALPARLREKVQVYGFHGLSHAWSTSRVAEAAPAARRLLIAHLGGGQSLCGVLDGRSVVTTMGFTPLDGLVMATRSGTVDPGALLWLADHTDEDLYAVLEHESGLQGIAGTSDMATVLDRAGAGDAAAELALSVWLHRFLRQAGGCLAVLGGLDALVFTGGIGEHSAAIRAMVCDRLAWLGTTLSEPAGTATDDVLDILDISAPGATARTFVVHAREDRQMLHEAHNLR
ncbi:MAG TPA: acetate/propionate family kinase [Actinophytocola sp.]|jgi:acetate kinase|nr:acetate/propionate family kinase [Actinophytocola sp.]